MKEEIKIILLVTIVAIITMIIAYLFIGALPIWDCNQHLISRVCRLPPWRI